MKVNKKVNERKEIGVGFTEIIIHNFMNFITFIVCLIANFFFFLFSFLITYVSFFNLKYFFFIFSVMRSIKLIIFSLFFCGIIFINFHFITILLLKFFIFSLEFLSLFFSLIDLLLASYFLIIDIFLILLLAIPLVYFLNFIPDMIAMFPEFPRHFVFEGNPGRKVQLLEEWSQYFTGMTDGAKDGFPLDAHVRKPPGERLHTDDKSPLIATSSYQYWLDNTYSLKERAGSDMANPETRGLISNFIYNHVKDDSLLRLIRASIVPRSLREAINDFDYWSSDRITKTDTSNSSIGGRPLFWSGHWRFVVAPMDPKAEYSMEDYRINTWAYPNGSNNLANAGVVDFSSKPIKTLLIAAQPSKMPDDQKMYAYNEDFKFWELNYWRSSFYEETRGKIVPLVYNSSVATFFNFKRMAFKWLYHYTYQIIFLPFLYLNFYNIESLLKKFRLMLYSTVDFFLEFGYNVPGSTKLDYNFFLYNLEIWWGSSYSNIFMGYSSSEDISLLMDLAFLFQRFFFYTDTGIKVLFLNPSLTEKSFLNMTFYDWAFFGFPFLLTFLFLCFIIYPIAQGLTLLTHHNWLDVSQVPWIAFSDPNPLHYHSFDFFMAPPHLFYLGIAFVAWFTYYYNVFTPLFYIDSTSMAIERDLTRFYSYPAFDDFSVIVEDENDIKGDNEDSLMEMEDVELDSMLDFDDDEDNFDLIDYDEDYFDYSNNEAFVDPPDLGFLTVNDSERDIIYRNFKKDNLLTYNSNSIWSLDWLKRMHNKFLKSYAVPVNKIRLGKEKILETEFNEELAGPFKKLIEYQHTFKQPVNDKDYIKFLVDKREEVPNLSFLLYSFLPSKLKNNLDIYPGLKFHPSKSFMDPPEIVTLKKEYFSFWFLDSINHVNVKELTSSQSFSVFAVEALVSFYFFLLFGSLYYFFVDGVIYTIFLYMFSFVLFLSTIYICYIIAKFLTYIFNIILYIKRKL